MKYAFTPYVHSEAAFREVERFLGESCAAYRHPRNWLIDRWNFTFTVSRTMHGESVENWERRIGLWRSENGRIAAMAHEEEQNGDAFFEFASSDVERPDLIADMFDFAERSCVLPRGGGTGFGLRIPDDDALLSGLATRHGYTKGDWSEPLSVRPIDYTRSAPGTMQKTAAGQPQAGDAQVSVQDLSLVSGAAVDPAKKALAHAKAFGYADTRPETIPASIAAFEALLGAPSYRPGLDLAWQNSEGEIVSFVGLWFDPVSRLAVLEPVGTIPGYRLHNLAERLIDEGSRRLALLGATELYVGSDQPFYQRIGFKVVLRQNVWEYREPIKN